ncbi:hypothetical protein ACIP5Y_21760 [Nocardia sp. NPDC088792]
MNDEDVDRWLRERHDKLLHDLGEILDLDAGLAEILNKHKTT